MDIRHIVNAPDGSPSRNPKVERGQVPVTSSLKHQSPSSGADAVDIDRELQNRMAELVSMATSGPEVRQDRVAQMRDALSAQTLHQGDVFEQTAEAMLRGDQAAAADVDLEQLR